MKVEIQNINQNVDMDKTTYRIPDQDRDARMADVMTGYSLDITGNVTDNMAYEENGLKSVQDVKLSAGVMDVTTQRNYMAVMSNSMSTEDFAELLEEGYHPGEIPAEDMVTNLDKIKAKMAESGNVVEGYNDDLSVDEMTKITGNVALAEEIAGSLRDKNVPVTEDNVREITDALRMTEQINEITDGMVKYLVTNGMEPTIDNLYKAEYSSGDETRRQSKGYYRDGNGYYAQKADRINWDSLREAADRVISEAGLSESEDAEDNAKWIVEQGLPLTADVLNRVYGLKHMILPSGSSDSIEAMSDSIMRGLRPHETVYGKNSSESDISLKRYLEETRLSMSIAANRALMRQGLKIETRDLERAVELLKEEERELFGRAIDVIQEITEQPAESIGVAAFENPRFTLTDLHDIGLPIKAKYELNMTQVIKNYEAVWTAPRSDMGDSIQKAFRNVDDILTDMDYELNEINRKTMRILGYTQTEVTQENFDRVREATRDVLEVIERMTPEKTLEMIRDGFNPLTESVSEVNRYLKSKQDSDRAESYSEYIWKLDKNKEVTESEKEAYIGIYRLIRQIEKNDGRPIGDVLSSDEELTLRNLLTAIRNRKHSGIDVSVDDAFGTLETLNERGKSITDQIMQAFDKVLHTADSQETNLEYARELRMEAAQSENVSDDVINALLESGETLSTDNIMAMDYLMHMRGMTYANLKKSIVKSDSEEATALDERITRLKDSLDDDNIDELYRDVTNEATEFVNNEMYKSSNPVEVKELRLLNKQLSLAGRLVKNENYEVPIEIDGTFTSVNLKIIRGTEDASCRITFTSVKYGTVNARFNVSEDELKGYVLTDSEDGGELLRERKADFIKACGYGKTNIDYLVNDTVKNDDYIYSEKNDTSLKALYKIAKAFLNNL